MMNATTILTNAGLNAELFATSQPEDFRDYLDDL